MQVKQVEAATHIRATLAERGYDIPSRSISVNDNERWLVFELNGRRVGIDPASGVWTALGGGEWRCLAVPATVSAALEAAEFLIAH